MSIKRTAPMRFRVEEPGQLEEWLHQAGYRHIKRKVGEAARMSRTYRPHQTAYAVMSAGGTLRAEGLAATQLVRLLLPLCEGGGEIGSLPLDAAEAIDRVMQRQGAG